MPLQWPWDGEGMGVGYEESYVDTWGVSGDGPVSLCSMFVEWRVDGGAAPWEQYGGGRDLADQVLPTDALVRRGDENQGSGWSALPAPQKEM